MSATLHSIYQPLKSALPPATDQAFLWASLVADGPMLDIGTEVSHKPYAGGSISVRFASDEVFVAWSRYLGLDTQQEIKATRRVLGAKGSVTREGRTGIVELHCTVNQPVGVA